MHGYKALNIDMTCRGYKFKIGSKEVHKGRTLLCDKGFHFCTQPIHCFEYYDFDPLKTVLCEIEAKYVNKETHEDNSKRVCKEITLLRKIPWKEIYVMVNFGKYNTGIGNTGSYNKGNWNLGHKNIGNHNIGDSNIGNGNVGNGNIGSGNIGSFNLGHNNKGIFNTFSDLYNCAFNKSCKENLLSVINFNLNLHLLDYKKAWKEESIIYVFRRTVINLPNFDANIFEQITGLKYEVDY